MTLQEWSMRRIAAEVAIEKPRWDAATLKLRVFTARQAIQHFMSDQGEAWFVMNEYDDGPEFAKGKAHASEKGK